MGEISVNRKAYFDYEILETYEAGIELYGFEVKAVKTNRMNLTGAFVVPKDNGLFLINAAIAPYQPNNTPADYDPNRSRRLLLKKIEIKELSGAVSKRGLTIVPLRVYIKHNLIKISIGLALHKKKTDKRELIKKREATREVERVLKRG